MFEITGIHGLFAVIGGMALALVNAILFGVVVALAIWAVFGAVLFAYDAVLGKFSARERHEERVL